MDELGPRLVTRGALIGCAIVTLLLCLITSGMSTPTTTSAGPLPTHPNTGDPVSSSPDAVIDQTFAVDECRVSDKFPEAILQWCSIISAHAEKHDLSPDLIAAIIWQESGGDPGAYSKSGAVGLMQVMPSDGLAASFNCINGPCFSNRPTIQELQDPEFNIAYGTRLLANLVNRTGSIREALKSYGPMNMGYYYADLVLSLLEKYGQ